MSNFHPIDLHQLSINPFQAIADQWMLITAEKPVDGQPKANTMTASWGGLGHLWSKDVAFAFIRLGSATPNSLSMKTTASPLGLLVQSRWKRRLSPGYRAPRSG